MRVNCSLPGRRGDRVVGERGEGLGVPERIPNPPPGLTTPGLFSSGGWAPETVRCWGRLGSDTRIGAARGGSSWHWEQVLGKTPRK